MRDVNASIERLIESHGALDEAMFVMQADGKAFKILIDGLYSDKPRAIIRELCSNAYDSHRAAGCPDRPFRVQLPTRLDNTFAVRDYGVSLSHETVMTLYRTVFASSKEQNNNEVGKFGLGSKSPFAYTDAFTVTAIMAGERRIYSAFLNAQRIPTIALFSREPCLDEETGVEITFPIADDDRSAFINAARRVFYGFEVQPITNIPDDLGSPDRSVIAEGAGWTWYKRDYKFGHDGLQIRQGCVLYPFDLQATGSSSIAVQALAAESIILDMPIGSVDITPSRESLSYDPTTIANLVAAIDLIAGEVGAVMTSKVQDARTVAAAMQARQMILSNVQSNAMRRLILRDLRWRGKNIPNQLHVRVSDFRRLSKHGLTVGQIVPSYTRRGSTLADTEVISATRDFDACMIPTFYYYDGLTTPKYFRYRLQAVRQHHANTRGLGWQHPPMLIPNFKPDSMATAMLRVLLGRAELEFVDILSLPFDKPIYKKQPPSIKLFNLRDCQFEDASTPEPEAEHVYYTYTERMVPKFGSWSIGIRDLARVWSILKSYGFIPATALLVGIGKSVKGKDREIPAEWLHIFDYAREAAKLNYDYNVALAHQRSLRLQTQQSSSWLIRAACLLQTNDVDPLSSFATAFSHMAPIMAEVEGGCVQADLVDVACIVMSDEEQEMFIGDLSAHAEHDLKLMSDTVELLGSRYPLLAMVDMNQNLKACTDYIMMVDLVSPMLDTVISMPESDSPAIKIERGDGLGESLLDAA